MTRRNRVRLATRRPDADNWFIAPTVDEWYDDYVARGESELDMAVPGTRFRASWSGDCARALAYRFAGFEESDPPTVADCWRFNVGTLTHEHVQAAIERAFPGSSSELKLKLVEVDGSCHADMKVVREKDGEPWVTAVEVKSINGTGYRRMLEQPHGEGIRYKYVMQGAFAAEAMGADELVIAVFSLECMSPAEAKKQGISDEYTRFAAQWTFTREEFMAIAAAERERVNRIMELVDSEPDGWARVPRKFPDPEKEYHEVTNPEKGTLMFMTPPPERRYLTPGRAWQCGYCPLQGVCVQHMKEGR